MRRIRKRKHIFESKCRTTWVQREGDPLVGKKRTHAHCRINFDVHRVSIGIPLLSPPLLCLAIGFIAVAPPPFHGIISFLLRYAKRGAVH